MKRPLIDPARILFRTAAGDTDVVSVDGWYLPGRIRSDGSDEMRQDGRLVWRDAVEAE